MFSYKEEQARGEKKERSKERKVKMRKRSQNAHHLILAYINLKIILI